MDELFHCPACRRIMQRADGTRIRTEKGKPAWSCFKCNTINELSDPLPKLLKGEEYWVIQERRKHRDIFK